MYYTPKAKVATFVSISLAIFVYIGFQLDAFRFSTQEYDFFTLYCNNSFGLLKKADARIAGVKVGFVEEIDLIDCEGMLLARVTVAINKGYSLYKHSYGVVRKDSLLGSVYIELIPGDPTTQQLPSGDQLSRAPVEAISVDELLQSVKLITEDVQRVSTACKSFFSQGAYENNGFVRKLLDDDQVYQDIKYTTDKVKKGFQRFGGLFFVYDGHLENMLQRAENTCFKDVKGFFNVRIFPRPNYFYLIGVTTSQKGYVKRVEQYNRFSDNCFNEICPEVESLPDWAKLQFAYNKTTVYVKRNACKVDLQIGKMYTNIALRAGLIEGTGGVAVDFFASYKERYGLISTFKLYDLHGQNRLDDNRPHLKWINRIFIFDHVYLSLGFDDFASRCNCSFFLGAGFRFGEKDLKWFLPNYIGT